MAHEADNKPLTVSGDGQDDPGQLAETENDSDARSDDKPPTVSRGRGPSLSRHLKRPRTHRARLSVRPFGRQSMTAFLSSHGYHLHSNGSDKSLHSNHYAAQAAATLAGHIGSNAKRYVDHYGALAGQVGEWLRSEKSRRASRKPWTRFGNGDQAAEVNPTDYSFPRGLQQHDRSAESKDTPDAPDSPDALEQLEQILSQHSLDENHTAKKHSLPRPTWRAPFMSRRGSSSYRRLFRKPSSEADHVDGDLLVPSSDVILDNTKTLRCSDKPSESETGLMGQRPQSRNGNKDWLEFKNEIIRLARTLRLKGWRRVALDRGEDIEVIRLSGALTNAVYVVSPPKVLDVDHTPVNESNTSLSSKKTPSKLLLRIYGPQVEHLIDREVELQILRRLARKHIGPRLLGTFANGRFEEFFQAQTLTAREIRLPEISKQIAKRMRELHDGIELLSEERDAGPAVWANWDKWIERADQVMAWADKKVSQEAEAASHLEGWKRPGFICGMEWRRFKQAVDLYRQWLVKKYGGPESLKDQLVFAHNDTQYGNILRLDPGKESPLLLPTNEHKRLVVIDFEYASANLPALEFANHFTEWCYDYSDPDEPYALREGKYPTPEEQRRFIRAYLEHDPPIQTRPTTSTRTSTGLSWSSSIQSFMLDSRASLAQITDREVRNDKALDEKVELLMAEVRLWRIANTAQWTAWGIVQARIAEMEEELARAEEENRNLNDMEGCSSSGPSGSQDPSQESDPVVVQASSASTTLREGSGAELERENSRSSLPREEDDNVSNHSDKSDHSGEFDYLAYAHERAMLFWGDIVGLGILSKDILPEALLPKLKYLDY